MTADSHLVCRRCGFSNVAGDQFCGSCGAFLEWEGEPETPVGTAPVPSAAPGASPDVPTVRGAGGPVVPPPVTQWGSTGSAASSAPTEPTPVPTAPGDGSLIRCPACGIANAAGRTFCQSCGTKLAEAPRVGEVTAAQIAAAVNTPARPVTVQTTTIRPASGRPGASRGGIAKWIVLMAVIGILVGGGAVVVSQLLKGSGPASVASTRPSVAPSAGASAAAPSGEAPSGAAPSGEAPSAETPSDAATAAPTAEPKPAALALTGAVASSVVGDLAKFQPEKAIDGNPKTCWQEGTKLDRGQWIEVTFAPSKVTSLVLTNGYNASQALYKGNRRLKDIAISVNGATVLEIRLKDTGKPQKINFKDVAGANTLRITILSTYASSKTSVSGTPFGDAALGEIEVMGVPGS